MAVVCLKYDFKCRHHQNTHSFFSFSAFFFIYGSSGSFMLSFSTALAKRKNLYFARRSI